MDVSNFPIDLQDVNNLLSYTVLNIWMLEQGILSL